MQLQKNRPLKRRIQDKNLRNLSTKITPLKTKILDKLKGVMMTIWKRTRKRYV
ncbi:hypothetical protein PHET_08799 [Paragonimus heterotremus]|uniref:Uncharacterized protein n=1 Tax=Paragonimus heterotremus TaxID=100268 RepID=A0A8J4WP10_9TREM|nr:hypothetical protein PHET_08799 [Paragonimus heterotremus]